MLNNSHNLQFGNPTFNNVQGNQNIAYYQHRHQLVPTLAAGEEWKRRMYQEYDRVRVGNIKFIRTFAINGVSRNEYEDNPDGLALEERYDRSRAHRVTHSACLVEGEKESSPFLCVEYTGHDAQKLFKRDCLAFSRFRHAYTMQLRGFNDSDTPMVFFHEEVIPVQHIMQQHHDSSVALQCYFSVQATIALANMHECYPNEMEPYHWDNVWVQPRNGRISFGLMGPDTDYFEIDDRLELLKCKSDMPALSIDMYNSNSLLQYLLNYSSDNYFLSCLSRAYIYKYQENMHVPQICHVWAHSSGQPIASFQHCWRYQLWTSFHKDFQQITLEDGRTRFSIKIVDSWKLEYVNFSFRPEKSSGFSSWLEPVMGMGWLVQSCSIFRTLNIPRNEWSDCALIDRVCLRLAKINCKTDTEFPFGMVDLETQCYLFVFPPPQNPDGSPDIDTWMSGKKLYYWSSDSNGQSVMPESQQILLGLPSFTPVFHFAHMTWSAETYDLIWEWQKAKGFDPLTTDFANSLGYPTMEVISSNIDADEGHFKVLSDDIDIPSSMDGVFDEGDIAMDVDSPTSPSHSPTMDGCFSIMEPDMDMEVD